VGRVYRQLWRSTYSIEGKCIFNCKEVSIILWGEYADNCGEVHIQLWRSTYSIVGKQIFSVGQYRMWFIGNFDVGGSIHSISVAANMYCGRFTQFWSQQICIVGAAYTQFWLQQICMWGQHIFRMGQHVLIVGEMKKNRKNTQAAKHFLHQLRTHWGKHIFSMGQHVLNVGEKKKHRKKYAGSKTLPASFKDSSGAAHIH